MSTQNRRSSFSSSISLSLAKRQASSSTLENPGKATMIAPHLAKKRAPLSNITNVKNVAHIASRSSVPFSTLMPSATKSAKAKKAPSASAGSTAFSRTNFPASLNVKSSVLVPCSKVTSFRRSNETTPSTAAVPASCSMDVSPSKSDGLSVSLDETMSTCESYKSPEVEYIDNNDLPEVDSINRKTLSNLYISDHEQKTGNICNRDVLAEMETDDKIVNVDNNYMDPQLCATIAFEAKKRPSTDFMDKIQKDVNASMRAILIDWLVEVIHAY